MLNPDFPNWLEVINDLFQEFKEKDEWESINKLEIIARQQQLFEAFIIMGQVLASVQHQVHIVDTVTASVNTRLLEMEEGEEYIPPIEPANIEDMFA